MLNSFLADKRLVRVGVVPTILPRKLVGAVEMLEVWPSIKENNIWGMGFWQSKHYETHLSGLISKRRAWHDRLIEDRADWWSPLDTGVR